MGEVTNMVRIVWDWKKDKIAKGFGFFSYNTGAPRWNQINMYIVDILMEEVGAVAWSTDGCTNLVATFEVKPRYVNQLVERVTKELRNGDLSRFSNHSFYPFWIEHRRAKRHMAVNIKGLRRHSVREAKP